ncbi:MAG: hypothetical protein PHD40_09615 [Syntrophomonadaceae bacterium]|nr:hypothetical protein [Syntrophomonadaceae bacterium]
MPDFSANGNHSSFNDLYDWPVEYVTVSTALSATVKYHLRKLPANSTKTIRLDPFVELGAGVIYFFTQLGYTNPPPAVPEAIIFGKGTGKKPRSEPGNVMQATAGLGTEIDLPQNISLILSVNADIVNYECLDAVHNYAADGERIAARTIVGKIMAGIIVPFGSRDRRPGSTPWSPGDLT